MAVVVFILSVMITNDFLPSAFEKIFSDVYVVN